MKKSEKLGSIISKAFQIYYAKPTYEMRDLADTMGTEAVREQLKSHGVQNQKDIDLYLQYLEEIKIILDEN